MNKQEKELLISFVNSAKEDLNFSFGICQKTYYGYVQGNKLINYIEHLYEPQKVKVPECVAEYIIWCHSEGLTLWKVFKNIRGMPEKVWKWLKDEDHQAIFSKAYTDGYEVEEEPRWVVKNDKGYVAMENFKDFNTYQVGVRLSIVDKKSEGSAWDDEDLKKAEALAVLVDGSVEEA